MSRLQSSGKRISRREPASMLQELLDYPAGAAIHSSDHEGAKRKGLFFYLFETRTP